MDLTPDSSDLPVEHYTLGHDDGELMPLGEFISVKCPHCGEDCTFPEHFHPMDDFVETDQECESCGKEFHSLVALDKKLGRTIYIRTKGWPLIKR